MAKANLTKAANIQVTVREKDFVSQFAKNWEALQEIWGIMNPIKKEPGSKLVSYTASVTLANGAVGEGEEVPYSLASVTEAAKEDLVLRKYKKAVSIEAVDKYGAENAIERTDEAFLDELQDVVMDDFYTFLATGTLVNTDPITTFQMGVAMAVGMVKDKFKAMHKTAGKITVFVNTLDAYKYLGAAELTVQTAFGIDYIKNFMGADTVILSSEITAGKIYATPVKNIVCYYADPSHSDYAQLGLDFTVDGELPLIGFHAMGNYDTFVGENAALMGMKLWAEYLDGIANITVTAAAANTDQGEH